MKTDKHCEAAEDRLYFLQKEVGAGIFLSTIILKKYSVLQHLRLLFLDLFHLKKVTPPPE